MSDPILKIHDATRSYGEVRALRGVSLEVKQQAHLLLILHMSYQHMCKLP